MVVIPNVLSDHPSLIGIMRMPKCTYKENTAKIPILSYTGSKWVSYTQPLPLAEWIKSGSDESVSYSVSKAKTTDFYPYTFYMLTDGECEPLIMHPQYLPSSFTIKGKYACSNQPIERYYPSSYKGSTDGSVYNITNTNQMMLPTATNEGIEYMTSNSNTMSAMKNKQNMAMLLGGVSTLGTAGLAAASGVGIPMIAGILSSGYIGTVAAVNSIKEQNARQQDTLLSPTTVSNWGTPSTRDMFGTNCVRLLKYTVRDEVKNKIESFVERYGNKYNNYATINHKTYKGYVKMIAPDIDSGIDNMYIQQIKQILERGIYIE